MPITCIDGKCIETEEPLEVDDLVEFATVETAKALGVSIEQARDALRQAFDNFRSQDGEVLNIYHW
jgi:hypothetical protein